MTTQFTLTRAEVLASDPAALKARIIAATGSEIGAESILRSLERLGTDESIERYEMTNVIAGRSHGGVTSSSWRIRAERAEAPGTEAAGQ